MVGDERPSGSQSPSRCRRHRTAYWFASGGSLSVTSRQEIPEGRDAAVDVLEGGREGREADPDRVRGAEIGEDLSGNEVRGQAAGVRVADRDVGAAARRVAR